MEKRPLFHNIFNISLTSGVKLYVHLWSVVVLSQTCKSDMSRYGYLEVFHRVLRLRDNESRLYYNVTGGYILQRLVHMIWYDPTPMINALFYLHIKAFHWKIKIFADFRPSSVLFLDPVMNAIACCESIAFLISIMLNGNPGSKYNMYWAKVLLRGYVHLCYKRTHDA